MPNFEFIQEAPLAGVGFVYKSESSAFYFDGATIYPIRQVSEFIITTGSGTTTVNVSEVTSGALAVGMDITGMSGATSTVTISIASPADITWTSHGLPANQPVKFTTTGNLPTGLFEDVTYYVLASGLTTNTFRVSLTPGGTAINTSGTQSGTHTAIAVIRIVSFGTFDGTSGTIVTNLARTFTNPTTISGLLSNDNGATIVLTAGTGTTTLTIGSVLNGTVSVGQRMIIGSISTVITAFGTFNGVSGTVTVSDAPTFTAPIEVTSYSFISAYPATTVRGIKYLEGTYYVMTPDGSIYGSAINDPLSWSALNVIQSQIEPDNGIALARQVNLLVAFGAYSTEFFYNAGNPTGSPLLPYTSSAIEMGCAVAESVSQTDNTIYFMGVSQQKGRGIYRFNGTQPEYVSNPFIDRVLNSSDLSEVSAFCVRIGGHIFYVLWLSDLDITLVYDSTSQQFATWTVTTPLGPVAISNMVWADGLVTVTQTTHGYADGDLITINGDIPTGYSGDQTINYVDADHYTYPLTDNPGTYVSGGLATSYPQSAFSVASYTSGNNLDIIQDSTTGFVYLLDNNTYLDNGNPIEVFIRTFKVDGNNNLKKFTSQIEIIGDKVDSTAYLRYTNDDYQTYSSYRPIDLDSSRSKLSRLGQARRRAYEIRHHDNVPLRLEALEQTTTQGTI